MSFRFKSNLTLFISVYVSHQTSHVYGGGRAYPSIHGLPLFNPV